MKIVLDTNCLLQIIPRAAVHRWLFDQIKNGEIELAITNEIMREYEEQLIAFYSPVVANGVLQILDTLENVRYIQVSYRWQLIKNDPDDDKFSDCAVAAQAEYLISYDRHFRVLKEVKFPSITCLTIEELKTVLSIK
ncbi:MAG: putative toxin-antitoxin system toxin component, PIN family [Saprospiraceae bacterium]